MSQNEPDPFTGCLWIWSPVSLRDLCKLDGCVAGTARDSAQLEPHIIYCENLLWNKPFFSQLDFTWFSQHSPFSPKGILLGPLDMLCWSRNMACRLQISLIKGNLKVSATLCNQRKKIMAVTSAPYPVSLWWPRCQPMLWYSSELTIEYGTRMQPEVHFPTTVSNVCFWPWNTLSKLVFKFVHSNVIDTPRFTHVKQVKMWSWWSVIH